MKKIKFDLSYRQDIEEGKVQVVTRDDQPVEILKWDARGKFPIVGLIPLDDNNKTQRAVQYGVRGNFWEDKENRYDLFLLVPEPLTEFEEELGRVVGYGISAAIVTPEMSMGEFIKPYAAKLLELAKKEVSEFTSNR